MGKEFEGGDVGIAVHNPAHQFGAGVGGHHRALFDTGHEIVKRADIAGDPGQQRDHQAPVSLGKQHQRADGIDQYMPQGIDGLHGRVAQRVTGLHDALGNTPGEVILKEVEALLEHVAVVLPADHAGHARAQGLVHQQVMQAEENGADNQCNDRHPDQLVAVDSEEIGIGRALGQVNQCAQVAEQRDFDQGGNQPDHQQGGKDRPHLAQVVVIKRPDSTGWSRRGSFAENIDQLFKIAIKHWH